MAIPTVKTRFQLKNDTEENWNKAINFVPLKGEVIIYLADDTHPSPRLKVGDGNTNIIDLPFIATGTGNIDGNIDLSNIIASRLAHKLIFGSNQEYVFDGSRDVTIPTYNGSIIY